MLRIGQLTAYGVMLHFVFVYLVINWVRFSLGNRGFHHGLFYFFIILIYAIILLSNFYCFSSTVI